MELAGCWRSIEARSAVTHSDRRSSVETFFKSGIVGDVVGAEVGARDAASALRHPIHADFWCEWQFVVKKNHTHTHKHTEHRKMGGRALFPMFCFLCNDGGV